MTHRVLVIGGGQNAEHEVSLETAAAVAGALRARGFEVSSLTIGRDGLWRHGKDPLGTSAAASLAAVLRIIGLADVVFPAVHGPLGEDGTLAALCALTHKPVVGSGLRAGAVGMDKWVTKLVAEAIGIRVAPGRLVRATDIGDVEFETAVVVKPVSAGSSYGVTFVRDACQLDEALRIASRYDDQILIEQVVRGREIDVAVLREADGGRWAPPPLEIHTSGLFDTATKYNGTARLAVPADLGSTDRTAITQAALAMFDALGCSGVARIDFFLTDNGPVLNEVNTMPGMTAASQVPRMFAAAGVPYEELVARLVGAARVPNTTPRAHGRDRSGARPRHIADDHTTGTTLRRRDHVYRIAVRVLAVMLLPVAFLLAPRQSRLVACRWALAARFPAERLAGLAPAARAAFEAARTEALWRDGELIGLTSGHRDAREQARLFAAAVGRAGSPELARRWVLPPEESRHVSGTALDIRPTEGARWLERHGRRYRLYRVYDNEWWHFEYCPEGEPPRRPYPGASLEASCPVRNDP